MWCVLVASTVLAHAGAQPPPEGGPAGWKPTPPPPDKSMTGKPQMEVTKPDWNPTDMAPHLAKYALNVDFGRYTNTRFYYQNNQEQIVSPRPDGLVFKHNCYDQFLQCMLSQAAPQVVCAYNQNNHHYNGFWTSESYCHVFFDNCRRRFRVWRVVGPGKCNFRGDYQLDKDHGYKGHYKNHKGDKDPWVFKPKHSWTSAPVTNPDIPIQ